MQIAADNVEAGLGLTQTTHLVNEHCRKCGLEEVGRSAGCTARAFG